MKKIVSLVIISCIFMSCEIDKINQIQNDFVITVNANPVISKTGIRVLNANGGMPISKNLNIEFSGAAADKIYTVNGEKTFTLDDGFTTIGLVKGTPVSTENPLEAVIKISGNGFITKEQNILFDGSSNKSIDIPLVEISNLPEGIKIETHTIKMVNGETVDDIVIKASAQNGAESSYEISIPKGTSFEDENGTIINSNEISFDMVTYDFTDNPNNANPELYFNPISEFGGGFNIDNAIAAKSKSNVKNASKSASNNFYDKFINDTSKAYALDDDFHSLDDLKRHKGLKVMIDDDIKTRVNLRMNFDTKILPFFDSFALFSFIDQKINKVYKKEIYKDINNSEAFINHDLISLNDNFIAGQILELNHSCSSILSIDKVIFINNSIKTKYDFIVTHKNSPNNVIGQGTLDFENEYIVNAKNFSEINNSAFGYLGKNMILKIRYYSHKAQEYVTVYNKETEICDLNNTTIDLTTNECFVERNIDLTIDCPNVNYVLNDYPLYFKKEGDATFRYYGNIKASKLVGKTPCLESGVKYIFRFYYDGWKTSIPVTEEELTNFQENFDMNKVCEAIDNF